MVFFYIILAFLLPVVGVFFSKKFKILEKIGNVVLMYVFGLIFGNLFKISASIEKVQEVASGLSIALAIPLILFVIDLKKYFRLILQSLKSLVLGILAVIITLILAKFLFSKQVADLHKILGLLAGLYTGGTPNLAALKYALNVDENTYIIVHSTDLVVGAFVLLFLITYAKKFFSYFLPTFENAHIKNDFSLLYDDLRKFNDFSFSFNAKIWDYVKPLVFAIIIAALSFGIGSLFHNNTIVSLLSLSTLSFLFSFTKLSKKLVNSYSLGMYFIYVFCFVVASQANVSEFFTYKNLYVQLVVIFVVIFSFIIHAFLSYIFKVNTDDFIISTTALVYSTPFVPVVAAGMKNPLVIPAGIIISLIGYIVGNYLGVFIDILL